MKKYFILIIALALGFYLRFHNVANMPNGLTWDEAALGYNAYSILKTGRDEFGKFLPIIFKSFGDYKPGLYVYLAVPSVAVFGLNEFSVRFPSVLFGVLAILGVYLLVKELLEKERESNLIASFCAFALAISPWHVMFSRAAWEVNVFSTLLLFGLYFLLRFIKGSSTILPAILFAIAALLCYQAAKLLTPLVYLIVILFYWSDFWSKLFKTVRTKTGSLSLGAAIIFLIWFSIGFIFGPAGNRLTSLSIFGYRPGISQETKNIDSNNPVTLNLYHNQTLLSTQLVVSRYLYHFSPEVLFYEGSVTTERGHIPESGVLNPLEIIWIVGGLIYIAKNIENKNIKLLLAILLVAPIPASLTLAEFSTVRSLFMAIPLSILSGFGIYYFFKLSKLLFVILAGIYFVAFLYIFDLYFVNAPLKIAKEFNYGYKQAMAFYNKYPGKRLIMSDVLGQPYIYYLFYTKYDPATYQKTDHFIDGGLDVGRVERVGNAEFRQFNSSDVITQKDTVFIGLEGDIGNKFNFSDPVVQDYQTVNYPDGSNLFRMIKTNP